jgi:hypothetical protein
VADPRDGVGEERHALARQRYMGMSEEGRLREHYFINGHFQDAVMFGLLEADYRRTAQHRLKGMIAAARLHPAPNTPKE